MNKLAKNLMKIRKFFRNLFALYKLNDRLDALQKQIDFLHEYLAKSLDVSSPKLLKDMDETSIKLLYMNTFGREPDLKNPVTFNEKIQWQKLNCRLPAMTRMADKYTARLFIEQKGHKKYLNGLYGKYGSASEFREDFDRLPRSFVLKASHWSGANMIVPDKSRFSWKEFAGLEKTLHKNYYTNKFKTLANNGLNYTCNAEWAYLNAKPCLIAEKLLQDKNGCLPDYKFYCFNGEPYCVQVDIGRFKKHERCFYDMNWDKLPFTSKTGMYTGSVKKPGNLKEMAGFARAFSRGFPHLRVDLYNLDDKKIIFGEFTFYGGSGTDVFSPADWDEKLGKQFRILKKKAR